MKVNDKIKENKNLKNDLDNSKENLILKEKEAKN
jgi:hypothetical protein